MAFDANRDIKIEASQGEDGTYSLRTKGLAARKRPELEIASVPEAALRAAAVVLNQTADYTVNKAEVLAEQNVGFELAVEDSDVPLMLVVHTVQAEAPQGGLWNKLTGGGKGVLRLVDVDAKSKAPLTALATMLVHRSRARLAKDDIPGAREELEAAIAAFPGAPASDAGPAPEIGSGSAVFNWQNHYAYLALAELLAEEESRDAEGFYETALRRSHELSRAELGATLAEIAAIDAATARAEAERIIETNLAPFSPLPGPTPDLAIVPSPVWDVSGTSSVRRAALVPAKFVELYYEGPAARGLREHGAALATAAFEASRSAPWKLAWRLRSLRKVWSDREAPVSAEVAGHPAAGLLSILLVEIARGFRAGAAADEIAARLAGREAPGLEAALVTLDAWEADQYAAAMSLG